MANGANVAVNLTFTADTGKVRSQLQDLSQQLQKITSSSLTKDGAFKGFSTEINEATKAASQLQAQLQSCTNVNTGKLDLTKFTQSLQQSGIKLSDYANKLSAIGPAGERAFSALAQAIGNAEVPIRKSSGMLANFAMNLKKVAQWQISSSVIHGFMSSLQSAYGYAQDLNASLNDIRIVTGQSIEQMDAFAKKANEAAKALSTTTNNYAKASLIFYQQGLGDADVKARTDAVMKMVNVTKDSAEQVSSYMTAIWNNFDDGTKSLEHYADVMTALGAATASSTAEIAAGLEKFASIGDTIGLSYEYATSALATIVAQTRQSSEVVGNGLRTIFSRLQGLKLGETLDDGVSLNKYSQALSNVGVQILDAAGNMKNMDTILDDLASKWTNLSKAQQTALAQTVGGVRQYTTLISLMDNWKSMEQNLMTAENSSGALQAQQDIYAESWKAAADEVRAAWEGVWQVMVDDDFFITMLNGIEKVITGVHTLIDSMGGLKGVMSGMGVLVTSIFGKDMIASIDRFATSLQYKASGGNKAAVQTKIDANNAMMSMHRDSGHAGGAMSADGYKIQGEAQNLLIANAERMNAAEQKNAQILLEQIQARAQLLVAAGEQAEKEEKIAEKSKTTINNLLEMTSTKRMLSHSDTGLSADALKNHLNTLTQLQNQYSALAPAANSIGAILDSTLGSPSEKIQAITQHMSDLEKKFADIGGAPEHVAQAMDKLNAALKSGDFKAITAAYGDLSKAMTQMEVDITKTENALLALKNIDIDKIAKSPQQKAAYQELIKAIDDYIAAERRKVAALQDGAQQQAEAEAALERYKQLLNNLKNTTKTFGEAVVGTMRGISSIMMGLNSLSSIADVFSDDSLSGWQKFSKIILSLSMGLPMLITGYEALHKAELKKAATSVAEAAGTLLQTVAQNALTTALGKTTIGQWALNAAMNANPVGLFLGAVVALVAALAGLAGIITLVVNAVNAPTETEEKLQKATKAAEELADSYDQAKQSYDTLMQDVSEYESVVDQLAQCTAGTKEWRDLTLELDTAVTNLITKYPQLAQYGKNITEGIAVLKKEAELNKLTTELAFGYSQVEKQIATNNNAVNEAFEDAGVKDTSPDSPDDYQGFTKKDTARARYVQQLLYPSRAWNNEEARYGLLSIMTSDTMLNGLDKRKNSEVWKGLLESYKSNDVASAVEGAAVYVMTDLMERAIFDDGTLADGSVNGRQVLSSLYNGYGQPLYYVEGTTNQLLTPSALKEKMPDLDSETFDIYSQLYEYAMYTAVDLLSEDLSNPKKGILTPVSYNGYMDYYHREHTALDELNAGTQSGYAHTIGQTVYGSLLNDNNAYLGEVAGNLLMAKAAEVTATYSKTGAKDLIKDVLGGTYVSEKDGVYTYRDSLGEEKTATIDSLRSQAGWRTALTQQDEIWSQAVANMSAIANSPIMQKFITNRNFDTATSKELKSIFGTGPVTKESVQESLLKEFGYTDINKLAKDLGYVGENGGEQLITEVSSLIDAAFKAPKEAINRLQSNLQNNPKFVSQTEQMIAEAGENLTLSQMSAIPTVLNDVNSLMGESGAQSLLNILDGLSAEELPKVLNALSTMDWTSIQSVDDLNSALLQQKVSVQGLGNGWITFAEDLIKAKKNISSILPTVSDLGAALQLTGSKAGETITQEQYDTLKQMGVLIDNFATLNADGEYVFFQDFMPNLAETVKNANELSVLLDSISETASLGSIDIQTPEGLSSFTGFLKGDNGKDLLNRLGISLKDEDYANQDYMSALYSKIINLLNTNVGYDENAMKSMLYTSATSEAELLQMAKTFGDVEATVTDLSSIDIASNTPLAKALALIRNTAEGAAESFNALTTSATTALSILQNLSFGSSVSAETYGQLIDYNNELANSFVQLADGSYRFIGSSSDIDSKIKTLIQSYDTIQGATIKDSFSSEGNLAKYADKTNLGAADLKALELAGYTPDEVAQLIKSKDEKAIAAFNAAMQQVFATKPKELIASMATSIGQLGSYTQTYSLGASEVKAQGQYLMSQATTLDELKAMQTELTAGEAFKSLSITTTDLTNGYVAGLLNIANGYASCKDEVKAYYEAVAKGDTTGISTAQTNLENAIALEDLATQYNTTTQAILAYKAIASGTTTDQDAAKAIAKAKSISALNKEYSDLVELGNSINTDDDGKDILTSILGDSEDFEAFVQAQEYFSDVFGKEITSQNTADLLQALDDETGFKTLAQTLGMTEESANSLWASLTEVEVDPFQQATDALSQAATKLANDLEKAKTKAENAKTVFEEMINVLSDKDAKKSMSYLEGLRDLGLSSTSSSSDIAKKYLDLQKEAIFKIKLNLDNMFNEDGTAFADSAISLDSIINLTDTKQLSAKLKEVFEDDNIANVAKEYFDTLYSETGSYTSGTVEGLIGYLKSHNQDLTEEWENFISKFVDSLTTAAQAQLQIEQETAQETANAWIKAYQAINDAREGLAKGTSIIETLRGDTEALEAFITTALNAGKNADQILAALASSSSTDWVESMTPTWSLKTQATGADITSQFLFKDGEYKGTDGNALVNYADWAKSVDDWVDTAFTSVDQLTAEQKTTYGITDEMVSDINAVKTRIKEYYRGTDGTNETPTKEYRNAQAAIIAAEGQHTWDELESKMTIAKNTRDTAMAKAEAEAKKNASIAKAVQALIDRDEDSDETLKEIISSSGATQEEFIALINEKYKDTGKQYTIDTVEAAIASGEIDLATVLAEAESKRDTAYGEATSAATTYAGKFDDPDELGALAGTQYEIEADSTVRTATLNQEAGAITGGKEAEKTVDAFTAQIDKLKMDAADLADEMSTLNSIDITKMPKNGTKAFTTLSNALTKAGKDMSNYTTEVQRAQMLADAQTQIMNDQSQAIVDQMSQYESKYSFNSSMTSADLLTITNQDKYQALQTYLELIDEKEKIDAQADEIEAKRIENQTRAYDNQYTALENRLKNLQANAEKTKTKADTLSGAIGSGQLTDTQRRMFSEAELTQWDGASTAAERAAIAAQTFSNYATEASNAATEMNGIYGDIKQKVTSTGTTAISDKDTLLQKLKDETELSETAIGTMGKAWDRLIAKGDLDITMSDLLTEVEVMGEELKASSDAATDYAADQIVSTYTALSDQNIAAAKAAADAWKTAFQEIAAARDKLLKGEDILSDVASNPEKLLNYFNNSTYSDMNTMVSDIISGKLTAKQLSTPAFTLDNFLAQYGLNMSSGDKGFGRSSVADDKAMARTALAAQGLEVSDTAVEAYVKSYYKQILRANDKSLTDDQLTIQANELYKGTRDYNSFATSSSNLVDSITLAFTQLQTALTQRTEAESALTGALKTDRAKYTQFNGKQVDEETLNKIDAAISNADQLKADGKKWSDLDAADRALLESYGITGFDDLSSQALGCANALAALSGEALSLAKETAQDHGFYKNADGVYETVVDSEGNIVTTGAFNADGTLKEGYKWSGNKNQGLTDQINTLQENADTATYNASDAGSIEALYGTEARMAGFTDTEEQSRYIDYMVEKQMMHSIDELKAEGKTMEEAIKIQRKYANEKKKMEKAYKRVTDEGKQHVKTLNQENVSVEDAEAALTALREIYEDILGPMDDVDEEFLKNEKNMELLEKAAGGDEEALNELSIAYLDAISKSGKMSEQAKADAMKLATELDSLADSMDLEIGASLDNTEFLSKAAELVSLCGVTADEASAALSNMGVDAEIVPHTLSNPASTEEIIASGGIFVPNADGTLKWVEASGVAEVLKSGGDMTYYTLKGATYNGKGVTGGGGGRRSGGGGGGRREARRANHTTMKPERYHKIDNHIDNLTDAYERLNKQEDRAWGKDRINAMKQVSDNLKQQVQALRDKRAEAEKYLAQDKADAEDYGFIFDPATGDVTNYEDVLLGKKAEYNAAIDAYNAMSAEQQEEMDKKYKEMKDEDGVYYSSYEDYLQKTLLDGPQNALDQYEETMETWEQLGLDISEMLDELYDTMVEAITYRMEFGMEITEEQLKLIEHRLKKIEDNAYKAAEAIAAEADKMNLHQQNYNLAYQQVDDLLKFHNKDWSAEDFMNGKISTQQLLDAGFTQAEIDAMKTSVETMMKSVEGMTESMTASYEKMTSAFEEFNEDLERYSSAIEHAQSITSSYRNILDLTGRSATGFTAELMRSFNANVVAQAKAGLTTAQAIQTSTEQQYQMALAKFKEAQTLYEEGSPEWLVAQAAFEAAEDNLNEAKENFMAAWEAALQSVADAYRSNMETAIEDISKKMANGLAGGLEALDTKYNRMKTLNDNYVDDYEKIYQLTKLTRDLETQIDNTSNVRAQKELLKFQKEINGILQSDKQLSEYDIDYLQKKYDLKLAEIALEDAQNAKSQVTMRRDSEGNYNYVYTADENAVAEAEAEYATKLYEMQKANDEYISELESSMLSLQQEMLNAMQELDPSQFASREEYLAALKEIEDFYLKQMNIYNQQLNNVISNNQTLWNEDMKWFNEQYGYKIADAATFVTNWNQTMLGQASGFATAEDFFGTFESGLSEASAAAVTAYDTFRQDMDEINAQAGHPTETFAQSVTTDLSDITNAATQASTDVGKAVTTINDSINSIGKAITDTAKTYKEQIGNMEQDTEKLALAVISLLTASGAQISVSWTQGQAPNIQAAQEGVENDDHKDGQTPGVKLDTGGYTGSWGAEGRLAWLHQKELVLNATDTSNILASVGVLRQIANTIDLNALASAGGFISLLSSSIPGNRETLQQEVHIEASFPAVTDKNQIEDAFMDLVNLAAQYANRN